MRAPLIFFIVFGTPGGAIFLAFFSPKNPYIVLPRNNYTISCVLGVKNVAPPWVADLIAENVYPYTCQGAARAARQG